MLDINAKFNQIVAALQKSDRYDEFRKEFTNFAEASVESKVNAGLAVLKKHGVIESFTESGGWGLTFKAKAPIVKHNGVEDNGQITEASPNRFAKADALMIDRMTYPQGHALYGQPLNEADKRRLKGEKPLGYDALNESQKRKFDQARMFGISEVDSFKLATMVMVGRRR